MSLTRPPRRVNSRIEPRIPSRFDELIEEDEQTGGILPFNPTGLPGLAIWLNSQTNPISAGNLAWADQSGNANNASQAATNWTYVGASSGVPAHLAYAGVGSSTITGVINVALPANSSYSLYVLRSMPAPDTVGTTFRNSSNAVLLWHDNFGAPGRTGLDQAGSILSINDNVTGWLVENSIYEHVAPLATLYHSNVSIGSSALIDTGGITLSYQVGGVSVFTFTQTARDISEILLYWGVAHDLATRTQVYKFLMSRIPA